MVHFHLYSFLFFPLQSHFMLLLQERIHYFSLSFFLLLKNFFIRVQLFSSVALVSAVQQDESLIRIHMCCVVRTQLCLTLCDPMDCSLSGSSVLGDSSDKNTGVGCHFLLQVIFLTQGSNLRLLHC